MAPTAISPPPHHLSPPLSPRPSPRCPAQASSLVISSKHERSSSLSSGGGLQGRRNAHALGLGVSFAPGAPGDAGLPSPVSSTHLSSTHTSSSRGSSAAAYSHHTSAAHSRRSSLSTSYTAEPLSSSPASLSLSLTSPSELNGHSHSHGMDNATPTATAPSSRHASRHPSLSHLASFLSGIEHHTRVRSPGVGGGRGVSRSASRSQSRVGERRSDWDAELSEEDEAADGRDEEGDARGRLNRHESGSTSPHPHGFGLVRENTNGSSGRGVGGEAGLERSTPSLWTAEGPDGMASVHEGEEDAPGLWGAATASTPLAHAPRTFLPLPTPRILSTEMDEEPFLDTAPSSPVPAHAQRPHPHLPPPVTHPFPHPRPHPQQHRTPTHEAFATGQGLEDVEVFEEGERVGVGVWLEGRGGWARDCFADGAEAFGNAWAGPSELEVVRRLGEGTYAIVYLVREVLYDPDPADDDMLSPIDAFESFQFSPTTPTSSSRPQLRSWGSDIFSPPQAPTYGRNFALKCLCKKDLSDELVEVQRGEAVLHRALPEHEYIVRLYAAYETDDWLFLVLEYCPGQDLFYWLDERQDDSVELYDLHSRAVSPFQRHSPLPPDRPALEIDREDESQLSRTITSVSVSGDSDRTPPSPSLLSSTANASLLSRKRLRLISRMFAQMCSAVQACHDVGISHRDIKPENFIVMDGRDEGESGNGRVVVKITDWGLGTREKECEDFDCGSKPYMAYECRNNLRPTYDPRQADVWSLGLVLLNLLYHRNPWAEPSLEDPDFAEYVHDPRGFLQDRFEGIGEDVAGFLADRVFCDVLEMEGDAMRQRVTAGEFGRWVGRLTQLMGEGRRKRASVSEHTFHLISSAARPTTARSPPHPPQASLLSQYAPVHGFAPSPPAGELPSGQVSKPDASALSQQPPIAEKSSQPSEPSPPVPTVASTAADDSPPPHASAHSPCSLPSPSFPSKADEDSPLSSPSLPSQGVFSDPNSSQVSPGHDRSSTISGPTTESETLPEDEGGEEPDSQNAKSKRRKRGARKGKTARVAGDTSPLTPSPLSPASPHAFPTLAEERDRVLADLAAASQDLARELSKTTRSFGTQSSSALRTTASSASLKNPPTKPVKSSGGGVFGRMKNLVKDGNPDLQAFKQRAEERNSSMGPKADNVSAPAKMQGRGAISGVSMETGMSSWGSAGPRSSLASWSGAEGDDAPRGRAGAEASPGHWSSASSRRERLDKQRRPAGELSPVSSTRNGTLSASSFDSRNHTPLSSFSSVASVEPATALHIASLDWRQPSPNTRPHTTSRPPPALRLHDDHHHSAAPSRLPYSSLPIPIANLPPPALAMRPGKPAPKPKLVDAAVDTADLDSAVHLISPRTVAVPLPAPQQQVDPATPPKVVRPTSRGSPNTTEGPPTSKNKLAKMLNSISVFNSSRHVPTS